MICMYVHDNKHPQHPLRVSDHLELAPQLWESDVGIRVWTQVLWRAVQALNHWPSSSVLTLYHSLFTLSTEACGIWNGCVWGVGMSVHELSVQLSPNMTNVTMWPCSPRSQKATLSSSSQFFLHIFIFLSLSNYSVACACVWQDVHVWICMYMGWL